MKSTKKFICVLLSIWMLLEFPSIGFSQLAEDYFNRATQYFLQGELTQARIELENVKSIDPDYEPANKLLSLIKEKTGLGLKGDILLSLDFKDTEITTILQALSKAYGLNIVAGDDVKGKVTVSFRDVTLEQALESVLKVNGFGYDRANNVISVRSIEGDIVTEFIPLKYSSADSVKDMLGKTLSSNGAIEVHLEANALVVTDLSSNIEQIKVLLKDIDVAPVQITIEAKLVDIQSSDLRSLGINYSVDYADTDIFGSGIQNTTEENIAGTINLPTPSSLDAGQFALTNFAIKHWIADATIDALISKQKAHLLASPSITTINNHEARIIIGEKFPYREETQTPVGTTETTRFVDIGISLSVTPRVSDDDYVTMTIHPEVSSVKDDTLAAGPRITTREADTTVRVRDGETIVIGGLIKNQDDAVRSRVPILGSLPIIGLLFSSKSEDKVQTELAVFITPNIIRPGQAAGVAAKFEPVSAEALYNDAQNLMDGVGVVTWDRSKEEISKETAALLEQLVNKYPSSVKADDALYELGLIYYKDRYLKDLTKAKVKLRILLNWYPDSKYAKRAASIIKKIERIQAKKK